MKKILLAIAFSLLIVSPIQAETLDESELRLIEAFEFLTQNYLYEMDSEELVDILINRMVADLDRNTRFLTPGRAESHLDSLHNEDNIYVKSELVGPKSDILYSYIRSFGENVSKQLAADIFDFSLKLAMSDQMINGIIIDLRHNGGGWLQEAVAMVDMFIDKGLILEERGRDGEVGDRELATKKMVIRKQVPIFILIDRQTASASEIVASALKDHDRAMILGVLSYGKATVQSYVKFKNGSTLWITSQKYYTLNGAEIHNRGISPNHDHYDSDPVTTFSPSDSPVKKAIDLLMLER